MSLTASIREQVRQRAQCACEFCGVNEIDVGGMLTIDHFQPRTKAGSDTLENLVMLASPVTNTNKATGPKQK